MADLLSQLAPARQKILFTTTTDPSGFRELNYHIPMTFRHESCWATIGAIDVHSDAEDEFTSRYLSRIVLDMAQQCVIPPPHLGGIGEIGDKKVLALALSGPRSSPDAGSTLASNLTKPRGPDIRQPVINGSKSDQAEQAR